MMFIASKSPPRHIHETLANILNTVWEIIFGFGVILGAALYHKTQPAFLRGILVTLLLSMICAYLFEDSTVITVFYSLFALATLIYSIYSTRRKKWLYVIIGAFAILYFLFTTFHWQNLALLKFLMIIPLISFAVIIWNWKSHKADLGILTTIASSELIWFIAYFEIIK